MYIVVVSKLRDIEINNEIAYVGENMEDAIERGIESARFYVRKNYMLSSGKIFMEEDFRKEFALGIPVRLTHDLGGNCKRYVTFQLCKK